MAMGRGEQRAIHPFFRRDFGVSANPPPRTPANGNLLRPSGPAFASHEQLDGQTSGASIGPDPTCNGSSASQSIPAVAAFDHDPNRDRRKRRKTNKSSTELPEQDTLSAKSKPRNYDSDEQAGSEATVTDRRTPETSAPDAATEPCHASSDDSLPQQAVAERGAPAQDDPTSGNDPGKKPKVIRLNPNGKLLSSPIADRCADKPKRKTGNKRGKSEKQKPEEPEQKLVIIKYDNKRMSLETLGKQIDDIMSGRTKHRPTNRVVIPTTTTTPAARPTKATHPFFLKKAIPKPSPSVPQSQVQDAALTPSNAEQARTETPAHVRQSLGSTSKEPAFFKRPSRFPEPIHPLWPPLGLTHIRDINEMSDLDYEEHSSLDIDQKKLKTPAIQITDDESVLSSVLRAADDTVGALRIPDKLVASGRVLQKTMASELSQQLTMRSAEGLSSNGNSHPAVAKLYSALPSSMTAFDRGEFDTQLWEHKYAPTSTQQVLCATKEACMLRDWLKHLMISSIDTGKRSKDNEKTRRKEEKKRKRRKKADKLDGFIVSSDDEASEMDEISGSDDELAGDVTVSTKKTVIRSGDLTFSLKSANERGRMTNAILLSGPPGCGKTASVYAVAKELDFEVFEINAGNRRSAKDMLDRIGDMTQNHLVHVGENQPSGTGLHAWKLEDAKQNKLMGFLNPTSGSSKKPGKRWAKAPVKEADTSRVRSQKQSLILLEEADVLFEEDKQFWSGVLTIIDQSKRPIIITCNDESLIPINDISFHAILRYRTPPQNLAVDYLLLVAANEGHVLKRTAVEKLYAGTGNDLRKSMMELNYWCQMGVGSEKSGLDWMIDRWPQGIDLDSNGDKLRMLSKDTYQKYMGWFSRDMLMGNSLSKEIELQEESHHWWHLSLQESDILEDSQHHLSLKSDLKSGPPKIKLLDDLRYQEGYMEMRSVLDVLAANCSLNARKDTIDASIPPIPERHRSNYIEGHQLLHADLTPDYTALTLEIGSTFEVLLRKPFRHEHELDSETTQAAKVLAAPSKAQPIGPEGFGLFETLAPISNPDCAVHQPNGRVEPSFEHGLGAVAEDLLPYARSIVAFDLRLEQYRLELNQLLSGNHRGAKRVRTTRASRAALEGGSKAETRRERWFPPAVNPSQLLATGKKEWQDLLVQNGYFTVPPAGQQIESNSDSPGDE